MVVPGQGRLCPDILAPTPTPTPTPTQVGPPLISQAFKEGLREDFAAPLEGEEAELEHLRQLLARAAGQRLPLFEY